MAEVLLSPGVLAQENDQSFLQAQPVQAGAAIIGPTLKGPVGIPTLVTTYSDFKNRFGCVVESGSAEYTYFTSISAYNYFQQGGDSLLVTRVVSGSFTPASSSTITGSGGTSGNIFTLETLSEGEIMNTGTQTGSNNTLTTGSSENVRWEISSPNSASGIFSLIIRQGNDTQTNKSILETFSNLSLDPNADNYIEKIIGNSKQRVKEDNGTFYVENSGSYRNISRYVRVKEVHKQTLNFFDNAGNFKPEFTGSIPIAQSGSFNGATGKNIHGGVTNFYQNVNSTNAQGLKGEHYTESISLLSNKDDYRYNVITAPGIIYDDYSGAITQLINTSQTRGDNLSIIDLVNFGSTVINTTTQAEGIDSSYAAAYWPWLQTIDPDLGTQVWVPASTMIPGVYAFNGLHLLV